MQIIHQIDTLIALISVCIVKKTPDILAHSCNFISLDYKVQINQYATFHISDTQRIRLLRTHEVVSSIHFCLINLALMHSIFSN